MSRRRFNFDEFCLDTITITGNTMTLAANGGLVANPVVRVADLAVSLQPVGGDKLIDLGRIGVEATHVALCPTVQAIQVGDTFNDASDTYEITYWEREGGNNPVGTVFAIYGKIRRPQSSQPQGA